MKTVKHLDSLASAALAALGIYAAFGGYAIYRDAGEVIFVSPGLFPLLMGAVLLFCSILLFGSSLKDGGFVQRVAEVSEWWRGLIRDRATATTLVGILIMFVYTYVLAQYLPFWLASALFLAAIMLFLRASSVPKIILLSVGTVAAIVVFFEVCFGVPLP